MSVAGGEKISIRTLVVGMFQVNCYIVRIGTNVVIIDPGDEAEEILREVEGLDVRYILLTHAHVDHVGALRGVCEGLSKRGLFPKILMHRDDLFLLENAQAMAAYFGYEVEEPPAPSDFLRDGDEMDFGEVKMRTIHVPGHSPGSLSYLFTDGMTRYLFTGDVLFAGSIGRTDLPGGSHRQLIRSIKEKLLVLPPDTVVYPGHGPTTTIAREKLVNPFIIFS